MPLKLLLGLHLCSMFTRVIPTEASGDQLNRSEQATQTIVVQSKLDLGDIESRLTNLESEVKSGTSTLESEVESGMSDVKSQISKLKSLITKFVLIKERKSWSEARRSCQALGGDLATATSAAEEQRLAEFLNQTMPDKDVYGFWIAARKYCSGKCGGIIHPLEFPASYGCTRCDLTLPAVCEKFVGDGDNGSQQLGGNNEISNNIDNDNDDDDDDDNENDADDNDKEKSTDGVDRFFVIKEEKSWEEARRSCQALGGDLATLASREDQQNLMEYLRKTMPGVETFWIGSKKGKTSGEGPGNWKWINEDRTTNPDDESFAWDHSKSQQLANKNQQGAGCMKIHPNGGICITGNCSASWPAACEKKN